MSEQTRVSHPMYNLLPTEIEGFESLAELALNLRWTWNHAADEVWWQLDPKLWEITRNPWLVLQTVSRERLKRMLGDPAFRKDLDGWVQVRRNVLAAPAWFQQNHSQSPLTCAAYFSLEFMLNEALPIYSGGLGNVAGDQLKAASDMAYLAIRGSGAVNGVSRLHGEVSRHLFLPLFPRWPQDEIPVGHVTNGVHVPTWDSPQADDLWTQACGKKRWLGTTQDLEQAIRQLSDAQLWEFRTAATKSFVEYVRQRLSLDMETRGAPPQEVEAAQHLFDPSALTLGFARRFATYKRPNLLLHDPQRLLRLLTNPQRPVQLILAGKAHPADQPGRDLIREWMHFIWQPEARPHVIFLSDYDMLLTEQLVQGVDVWINTPRRPWEACGTSGMKVLVNGGLNLSELDGWWAEAYTPQVGWALGDGREHGDDPAWDAAEAEALYDLLEREVIPEFYARDAQGIPTSWVARMRNSMASLTPRFSANRAVAEYTEQHYLPAAAAYLKRAADTGVVVKNIANWEHALKEKWATLRFGDVKVKTSAVQHIFEAEVFLNGLDPNAVRVELYAEGSNGSSPIREEMTRVRQLAGADSGHAYVAQVPATRPVTDYTARVIPRCDGVAIPLEEARILWQR